MQRIGHIGFALLMLSSISFALNFPISSFLVMALIATLMSTLPDQDIKLHRHRGVTHSLLFAVLISVIFGFIVHISYQYISEYLITFIPDFYIHLPSDSFMLGFIPALIGLSTHLIGDIFTYSGIPPLYPFDKKRYSLKLFRTKNRIVNSLFWLSGAASFIMYLIQFW